MGRKRVQTGYENRPIDIDLISYYGHTIQKPHLIVPHPHFSSRRFVLEPFADIAPDHQPIKGGQTIKELLACCQDPSFIKKIGRVFL